MKKFLALLFVCAGLTAVAAPRINKADIAQANKGQMVLKANNLAAQYTAKAMNMPQAKNMTPMTSRFTPNNLVEARKAPRRLSDADMIGLNSVCFLYAFDITGDEPVAADPFYAGSGAYWYPDVAEGLYFAGFYWDDEGSTYYLPLDIDYSTGEVALSWGILLKDDSVIGNARNRTDTVWYELLVSQAYWENDEQTDCMGTLYSDGSIIFDDNYVYYAYKELRTYQNRVLVNTDYSETVTMFVGTEILTANGELSYTLEQNGSAETSPVFMYQDADTLFVGNLWNYGIPSAKMTLTSEGKALYECAEFDPIDSITYLSNPIWDVNDTWISGGLGMFYPVGSYELDDEGYIIDYTWGFEADATPDQITWDYTMPCNGYHFLYGYENNVLRWTNGNQFVIPGGGDFLRGDANSDENVTIDDVTFLIDALLSGDFDALGDGADCNLDETISIDDVTALIDFLLSGNWPE